MVRNTKGKLNLMKWIDVNFLLPPNDQMVLVKCDVPSPSEYLKLTPIEWIFQGQFNRSTGWKVHFAPPTMVKCWTIIE